MRGRIGGVRTEVACVRQTKEHTKPRSELGEVDLMVKVSTGKAMGIGSFQVSLYTMCV